MRDKSVPNWLLFVQILQHVIPSQRGSLEASHRRSDVNPSSVKIPANGSTLQAIRTSKFWKQIVSYCTRCSGNAALGTHAIGRHRSRIGPSRDPSAVINGFAEVQNRTWSSIISTVGKTAM